MAVTLWYTRNRHRGGALATTVNVWKVCPDRQCGPGPSTLWLTPMGQKPAYVTTITLDECVKRIGCAPDDDMQCLRHG